MDVVPPLGRTQHVRLLPNYFCCISCSQIRSTSQNNMIMTTEMYHSYQYHILYYPLHNMTLYKFEVVKVKLNSIQIFELSIT